MNSHHYTLRPLNVSRLLDISEHIAAASGFSSKDIQTARLLAEEMISAVYPGISLVPGELWFSSKDGMFIINVSIRSDFFGITKQERIKLINKLDNPKYTGLFAPFRDFMDKLAVSDEEIPFQSLQSAPGFYTEKSGEWRLDKRNSQKKDESGDFEINLINGFADDILVSVKAKTFTISVMKKIPEDFLLFVVAP